MRVAHLTSGLCRRSAGLGAAVAQMSAATQRSGIETHVFGLSSSEWWQGDNASWSGAPATVFKTASLAGPLGYAPGLLASLLAFDPDVVHLHGLWSYPSIATYRWHQITGRPYVCSAHGMLFATSLEYKRFRKMIARRLFQDRVLKAASVLHATSDDEAASYVDVGLRNRVITIPLGLNIVPLPDVNRERRERRVLFLGRLHHQKGIDWLIDAWAALEQEFPDWTLSIVGPEDAGFAAELTRIRQRTSNMRVSFVGPLYGDAKYRYMANCELFVMPSRSENFGLTAAESLMMEVPVIATRGTPWSGLVSADAGWWIDLGPDALEEAMRQAMQLPRPDLRNKGRNGRRWIEADFSWQVVAASWQEVYESLLHLPARSAGKKSISPMNAIR